MPRFSTERTGAGTWCARGAFARAVQRGAGAVPLLWQHQPGRPIGRIEYLKEDKRGLRVIGGWRMSGRRRC